MRIRFALPLILGLVFLANGLGHASDLALVGAKLYPSPTVSPIENGVILVHDSTIIAVGPASKIKIPRDATIMNCKGRVVTAGFWNSHVHILTPGLLHVQESHSPELNQQLDTMFNRWGFTTVFDIASVLDNTVELRRGIESNELHGPRILTVGEPIWTLPPVYALDLLNDNPHRKHHNRRSGDFFGARSC